MEEEVRSFIKKELRKGMKPYSIKKSLVSHGYDKDEIDREITSMHAESKKRGLIILAAVVLLLILLLVFFRVFSGFGGNNSLPNGLDYSDEELLNLAVLERNDTYCDYIDSDTMRINCEALANSGINVQTELEKKDEELLNKAITQNKPELCELITYEDTRETCELMAKPENNYVMSPDEELLNQAVLEDNPSKCLLIESEEMKDTCKSLVS